MRSKRGSVCSFFLPSLLSSCDARFQSKREREAELEGRGLDDATRSQTLTATLEMLQPRLCCVLSFMVFISPLPADGQTVSGGAGRAGGVERVQVMFTPTICKVRCSQDRCVNYCERGNVTTLYSSSEGGEAAAAGRRDGAHGPGFRVCKSNF